MCVMQVTFVMVHPGHVSIRAQPLTCLYLSLSPNQDHTPVVKALLGSVLTVHLPVAVLRDRCAGEDGDGRGRRSRGPPRGDRLRQADDAGTRISTGLEPTH